MTLTSEAPQTIVSALLLDTCNSFLLAQRPAGKRFEGMWELPGGKLKPGESERDALSRELLEELGIHARPHDLVRSPVTLKFNETGSTINLYECRKWAGDPQPLEKQTLAKVNTETLLGYPVLSGLKDGYAALRQHYPAVKP